MKIRKALFLVAFALFVDAAQSQTPYFAWAASQIYPDVVWHPESAVSADMDCNGKPDLAMLGKGKSGEDTHLAVIIFRDGRIDQQQMTDFHSSRLNPKTAQLELENMDLPDASLREVLGESMGGYRRSKTCKGFTINDGEQDGIHIYWNAKTRKFSGWSL